MNINLFQVTRYLFISYTQSSINFKFQLILALINLSFSRVEFFGNQVVSLQEKISQVERNLKDSQDEKEKLIASNKRLQEELKNKDRDWTHKNKVNYLSFHFISLFS